MAQKYPAASGAVSHRLLAAAVFIAAAALYLRTTAPTLGGAFDSEEFQHVAYTLGIAHSTGYPLYLLLGKLFASIVPIGNIAYRMNLLSAFLGAGTVTLVYLNAWELTRRQLASLSAAALFATNSAVWRQAGVASVGPLHLFLVAAILYVLLLWRTSRVPLGVAAFVFGTSLTHHRTTLLFAPAIAVFVLLVDPGLVRRPRALIRNAIGLALPLLLYLYMPLFGSASPWYSNTLQGFIGEISGGEASAFTRATPVQVIQGITLASGYLFDSLGYLGSLLVLAGALAPLWIRRALDLRVLLFLGLCTVLFSVWGTLYAGEPDRYLVLPFAFLIYWFALGIAAVENAIAPQSLGNNDRVIASASEAISAQSEITLPRKTLRAGAISPRLPAASFTLILALYLVLPFNSRYQEADWSTFDRVYKQWDEIFTLPIPRGAVLVGNWGQLNAMRYMQRIENRRPDLELVGTLYDPAPQTEAALAAFADGRALFLAPGISLPMGTYHYALLGPLVEVRAAPQTTPPDPRVAPRNVAVTPALSLTGWDLFTALEPYVPLTGISPGRTARVALYWRSGDKPKDFIVRLGLFDPEGRLVSQKDEPPVRGLEPVSQWQAGEYVSDVHNFLIPPGSPPGQYLLKMQTLDAITKTPIGETVSLSSPIIQRTTDLVRDQVFVQHSLELALDHRVGLWGFGGLDGAHHPGELVTVNLLWAVLRDAPADFALRLTLVNASGKSIQEWTCAPIVFYPVHAWKKGELLKGYYDLGLAPDLPSGQYALNLALDQQPATMLAAIQIDR